jgi:hypothetical protein
MTPLAIFVIFGLPASLVALGWVAVFLHGRAVGPKRLADRPARHPTRAF